MFIQLEFCGLTKIMEVPEQIAGHLEIDWIPSTIVPIFEMSTGAKPESVIKTRLVFTYKNSQTKQGYMIYNLTHIDKIK